MNKEELQEYYQHIQRLAFFLQLGTWPAELGDEGEAKNEVVFAAQSLDISPKDKDFLIKLIDKIADLLADRDKVLDTSLLDPIKVRELREDYERYLEKRQILESEKAPPEYRERFKLLQQRIAQEIGEQSEKITEKFRDNPLLQEAVTEEITKNITDKLEPVALKVALTEEEYHQILVQTKKEISQNLRRIGEKEPKVVAENFVEEASKDTLEQAREVAITPRERIAKATAVADKTIKPEDLKLPEDIIRQLNLETDGVASLTLYSLLQPQAGVSYVRRIPYAVPVGIMRIAAGTPEMTPEWREMIEKGVFSEDIETTISKLKELGLKDSDPIIRYLNDKGLKFRAQQKIKIVRPDRTFYYQDKPAASILKQWYSFPKRTGFHLAQDEASGIFYQTSPAPDWSEKSGYSWGLHQVLNKIGLGSRIYETITVGPGKNIIRFTLPNRIIKFISFGRFESFKQLGVTLYQKSLGRFFTPIAKKILSSKLVTKAATWIATKLGVQFGAAAAGTALAPGVGTVIGLAVGKAIDFIKARLQGIWDGIKSVLRDPEKSLALAFGGIGIAALFSFSGPLVAIGVGVATVGIIGLIGWGVASAGSIVGGLGGGVIAFFTSLTVAPISSSAIILLVVGTIGTSMVLTFFIVMTTAGAFILPIGPTEISQAYPPPKEPPVIKPPAGLGFQWPIRNAAYCSSNFGYRSNPVAAIPCCQYHTGIDIVTPQPKTSSCGIAVYPTAKGTIQAAGRADGYGNYVVIKHNGLYSLYAHLESWEVSPGQTIERDEIIGYIGSTGTRSTGCHLHLGFSSCGELNCFIDGGKTPDPCDYLICSDSCEYHSVDEACQGLPLCQ
ncbi:MAG TPA: peptidoglycan DD-metalloendopeptidase family protein [Patescibacteria group bacterium]|nr:peptidoglycan DD-metalloendopeptidase family protein [Patescibacteria group bacterium]